MTSTNTRTRANQINYGTLPSTDRPNSTTECSPIGSLSPLCKISPSSGKFTLTHRAAFQTSIVVPGTQPDTGGPRSVARMAVSSIIIAANRAAPVPHGNGLAGRFFSVQDYAVNQGTSHDCCTAVVAAMMLAEVCILCFSACGNQPMKRPATLAPAAA